jgi:hypothetical protein
MGIGAAATVACLRLHRLSIQIPIVAGTPAQHEQKKDEHAND